MSIQWRWYRFCDISTRTLYELLKLRSEVFVVEQQCIFNDLDGADINARHLLGFLDDDNTIVAYCRVFAPTDEHIHSRGKKETNIGRVLVNPRFRRKGFGMQLMMEAMRYLLQDFPNCAIRIGAQRYLSKFYGPSGLGFIEDGEPYDEDGIPHIDMTYTKHFPTQDQSV